jgi:protocatechuate 3,4-dioxygenase beta subunit
MRPIHALILAVVLALGLFGLSVLLRDDKQLGPGSEHSAGNLAQPGTTQRDPTHLEGPVVEPDAAQPARGPGALASEPKASPAPTDAAAFTLSGRLVDARGRPVEGADVLADGGGPDELPLELGDGDEQLPWMQHVQTRSDAAGRFSLQPKARTQARLAARAAGFAPYDQSVAISGKQQDLGDVVLEDSALLSGRVIDTSGRGVEGAQLLRLRESGSGFVILGSRASGSLVASTDAQGRFRIDQLRAGPWKLRIASETHPDLVATGQTERPGAQVSNLEFVLADGDEIRGRVVNAPAELVPKLWVRAFPRSSGDESSGLEIVAGGELFGAARSVHCAPDGSFTLRGLKKGGAYRLVARDSEREYFGRARSSAVLASAGERDVQLPYKPETAVVCQVVDDVSGEPLEELDVSGGFGFSVPLEDAEGRPQHKFPGGRVRFTSFHGRGRPDQRAEFSVHATGYKGYERDDLVLVDEQDVDLGIVRLQRSPLVRVLVLDGKSGEPVAGAQVSLARPEPARDGRGHVERFAISLGDEGEDAGFQGPRRRTDKQGRAQLNSRPGESVVLRVTQPDHAPWESAPIQLPADQDFEQTVQLGLGGTVVAQVVDSQERPVSGAEVEHEGPGNALEFLVLSGARDERTDAQGQLVFEHLMPGTHRFRLAAGSSQTLLAGGGGVMHFRRGPGGPQEHEPSWTELTVAEGSSESIRFVAPERSNVTGRVREAGQALVGARVELEKKGAQAGPRLPMFGGGPSDQTGGQGEYQLANVEVGSYRVLVTHPGRVMTWEGELEVRGGENRYDIELPVAILEGQVSGPDGKPLAGVKVRVERASEGGEPRARARFMTVIRTDAGDDPEVSVGGPDAGPSVQTDAEGKYRLRGVLADVDLVVKAQGKDVQPGQSKPVRVAADQTRGHVDIQLETGGSAEVTLVRRDGQPASSCIVQANFEGEPILEPRSEWSGSRASVLFTGLKPGRWRLHVDPLGSFDGREERPQVADQTVEVRAGEKATARFEIP